MPYFHLLVTLSSYHDCLLRALFHKQQPLPTPCPQFLLTAHSILSLFTHSLSCCSESSFYAVVWIILLKCRSNEFTLFLKSLGSFPWFPENIYWGFHVWSLPVTCSFTTLLYGLARMVFLVSQYNVILCLKFAQCLFIPIRKEKSLKCIHITCKNFCQPSLPISSGSPLSSLQTSHSLSGIPGCTAIYAVCTPSPSCPPGSLYWIL